MDSFLIVVGTSQYVDLDYSGSGGSEYILYDRVNKKWDTDTCKKSGSKRCVKMNCHESNSHWSLLGVFKEPDYNGFMQQLFNYQGDCTWTKSEYSAMSSAMNYMPNGCTQANNGLYYDIKPTSGGSATIGLYDDQYCTKEHNGSKSSVKDTVGSDGTSAWNDAFDAFKYCHPCRVSTTIAGKSSGYGNNDYRNCQSNQGLNQCEQFAGNTNMYSASYHDIMAAEEQGTLSYLNIGHTRVGITQKEQSGKGRKRLMSIFLTIGSIFVCLWSLLRCARKTDSTAGLKQPLMSDGTSNGMTRRRSFRRSNSLQRSNSFKG